MAKSIFLSFFSNCFNKVKSSDIGNRIASGAFWSFTGNAVAKVIVLIAGILCAHILTKDQYGEFAMVRSTIDMFVIFGTAGLGMTATKYIAEYKNICRDKVGSIYRLTNGFAFITAIITCILVLLFSEYLASVTLKAPHLVNAIRVGALLLFVTILNGAQNGALLGFEDFKARSINTLIGSIFEAIFMLIGANFYGVIGAILGYGIGYIALYMANILSIHKNLSKYGITSDKRCIDKNDLKLLYQFSIPAALSSILVGPSYWISRTILVRSSGFSELAIYEAANYWNSLILFIPAAVSQIILPILSSVPKEDKKQFWKVLKINLFLNVIISTILALGASMLSPLLMASYGSEYSNYYNILITLVCATIFNVSSSIVGNAIVSMGKMWIGFIFNLVWSFLFTFFSWLFIHNGMGSMGVACALLLSYFLHTIYQFIYLRIESRK